MSEEKRKKKHRKRGTDDVIAGAGDDLSEDEAMGLPSATMLQRPENFDPSEVAGLIVPADELNEGETYLFYGQPSMGKTRLAATFPDPLIIDILDRGTKTIRRMKTPVFKVKQLRDLEKIYWYLAEADHPYKTVVLDNLSQLQFIIKQWVLYGEEGAPAFDVAKATYKDFGDTGTQMHMWILNFRNLIDRGITVVFLAWEKNDDRVVDGPTTVPDLQPAVRQAALASVNYIFRLNTRKGVNKKTKEEELQYILQLGPSEVFMSKVRKEDIHSKIPSRIVNPTYDKIVKYTNPKEESEE